MDSSCTAVCPCWPPCCHDSHVRRQTSFPHVCSKLCAMQLWLAFMIPLVTTILLLCCNLGPSCCCAGLRLMLRGRHFLGLRMGEPEGRATTPRSSMDVAGSGNSMGARTASRMGVGRQLGTHSWGQLNRESTGSGSGGLTGGLFQDQRDLSTLLAALAATERARRSHGIARAQTSHEAGTSSGGASGGSTPRTRLSAAAWAAQRYPRNRGRDTALRRVSPDLLQALALVRGRAAGGRIVPYLPQLQPHRLGGQPFQFSSWADVVRAAVSLDMLQVRWCLAELFMQSSAPGNCKKQHIGDKIAAAHMTTQHGSLEITEFDVVAVACPTCAYKYYVRITWYVQTWMHPYVHCM